MYLYGATVCFGNQHNQLWCRGLTQAGWRTRFPTALTAAVKAAIVVAMFVSLPWSSVKVLLRLLVTGCCWVSLLLLRLGWAVEYSLLGQPCSLASPAMLQPSTEATDVQLLLWLGGTRGILMARNGVIGSSWLRDRLVLAPTVPIQVATIMLFVIDHWGSVGGGVSSWGTDYGKRKWRSAPRWSVFNFWFSSSIASVDWSCPLCRVTDDCWSTSVHWNLWSGRL